MVRLQDLTLRHTCSSILLLPHPCLLLTTYSTFKTISPVLLHCALDHLLSLLQFIPFFKLVLIKMQDFGGPTSEGDIQKDLKAANVANGIDGYAEKIEQIPDGNGDNGIDNGGFEF